MKFFKLGLSVAIALVSFAALTTHSAHAAGADTVIIGYTDGAGSLDNADAYDNHSWEILQNTGEGLLKYKVASIDVEPGLATDMPKISADGLTYTFTLRDNLTFADGTPITAQTFVDTIKRVHTLTRQVAAFATPHITNVEA